MTVAPGSYELNAQVVWVACDSQGFYFTYQRGGGGTRIRLELESGYLVSYHLRNKRISGTLIPYGPHTRTAGAP